MNRFTILNTTCCTALLVIFFLIAGCSDQPEGATHGSDSVAEKNRGERLGPAPLRFENLSIRTEKYLLPAVSTGPLDPVWSPDGEWLAFSMRGDIWKVPARGGTAVALTGGPSYYFEPDWSPDGERILFTVDLGEESGYGIGMIHADGSNERVLIDEAGVNIEPEWDGNGNGLFFVSDRAGDLDIFHLDLESGDVSVVAGDNGNQIQPAVSPDGSTLAYVSPVDGKPGSGGIWKKPLPDGDPLLVHYEETRHRAQPAWRADGRALYYVTEITGSNDIGIVSSEGGSPVWLTRDTMHELSPAVSPDGRTLAFVSNRRGPTSLFTMPAGGGTGDSWQEVAIDDYRTKEPTGTLSLSILDPGGKPVSARIYLEASDGRAYTPDGGFHRVISAGERHYFHSEGQDRITVPAGKVIIEAAKGYEYKPERRELEVGANKTAKVTLQLERYYNPTKQGWFSGETHAHDLHGGRFGLTHESYFLQLAAEDLHITNSLIHRDGTALMGRMEDLSGEPHPLSTEEHILQYAEEFRGSRGHIGMLGIEEFVMPFVGGERGTAYEAEVLNMRYIDETVAQGGVAGFMHPYWSTVNKPEDGAFSEIPVDVALGKGSFYDVLSIPYDAFDNAEMYYRLLNSGFQIAATGGSDNFADVWRDPPAGTMRTYAFLGEQELSVDAWLEAVRSGHTFSTNGPLMIAEVDGKVPGQEINLTGNETVTVDVRGEIASIAPLERLEVLLNGEVVDSIDMKDREMPHSFSIPVTVEENGWIAIRAFGKYHQQVLDSYPFVQTTPVYVLRNGERYTSREDALFLRDVVDAFWKSVDETGRWNNDEERERFRQRVMEARAVYEEIANGNYSFRNR